MANNQFAIEDLIKYTGNSIYKLSVLTAQRALQIAEVNKDLISETREEKPVAAALREVSEGKIKFHKVK